MNIEILGLWFVIIGMVVGFIAWGIKRYRGVIADGVTLDEVIDAVEEAVDKAEEIKEAVEEAVESME